MDAGPEPGRSVVLALAGDVMTGRGIDQILPHPSDPRLAEEWVGDARDYVALAEAVSGPIPRRADFEWPWGDALPELEAADARIVDLETSITRSDDDWPDKPVRYRMEPDNAPCLVAAHVDVCALANNHMLDFGRAGLLETLDVLDAFGIGHAGAGRHLAEACAPARVELARGGGVVVFSVGTTSSGIDPAWTATDTLPGVDLLRDLSDATADELGERAERAKRPGDVAVASIHWGSNWGWEVPPPHARFAHRLLDAGFDLVHGHSSHHARPIEIYRGKLILYGAGDLVDDYEGIRGYEEFRGEIRALWLPRIDLATGRVESLRIAPFTARRFRLFRAEPEDADWLARALGRHGSAFGAAFERDADGRLSLRR